MGGTRAKANLSKLLPRASRMLLFVLAFTLFAEMLLAPRPWAGEKVSFSTLEAPGTIIVKTLARRLYFVIDGESALRYPIAVPKRGREWFGRAKVTRVLINPDWAPPPPVRADYPELPSLVPAGAPNNRVGARAILLDRGPVAIHGTSARTRRSIGSAASYGCIRMLDEDVIDLANRVRVGTPVVKAP